MIEKVLRISGRPKSFSGSVRLPPSKSYLHRALFVSAITSSGSRIVNCGAVSNDDTQASICALKLLGARILRVSLSGGGFRVIPGLTRRSTIQLDARGSGTTARFLIPFAALSRKGASVTIVGNQSLSKRPMEPIFEPLSRLGVNCRSINNDGKLPVVVEGGGIKGGTCEIDGTISSQFVSSLLISCVRAESDTIVSIKDPDNQVSKPYIESTLRVMASFGFRIKVERSRDHGFRAFEIPSNQIVEGKEFKVPGDFSSAAALIGVTLAAEGTIRISNAGFKGFSQSDSEILPIARQFGAKIRSKNNILFIKSSNKRLSKPLTLDLKDAPDLVPIIAGLAAATGRQVSIENIGHLRFKESDRIGVLSKELSKIGVPTRETESTLSIMNSDPADSNKVVKIDPANDHRMLMALTIAGLSGRFGVLLIQDPDCVRKSYPSFVKRYPKIVS